jgi:demethylmenaquinone methyltransferase/2-methoxy-6-polyprenyl-1,4-benzoquinol methylase
LSSEPGVGALLAMLAAAAPQNAAILELGTGAGVGLAWIVHGVRDRSDVSVVTVDTDAELLALTQSDAWPEYVEFLSRDGSAVVRERGPFDLIFADAVGGKLDRLDATIAAIAPRGILIVDDMDPALHDSDGLREPLQLVTQQIRSAPHLVSVELPFSTGVILAAKLTDKTAEQG